MSQDSFDFPSFFFIFDVRWGSEVVGSVNFVFRVGHKEDGMEVVVEFPSRRELKAIIQWS